VVFAQDDAGLQVYRRGPLLPDLPPADMAEALLGPIAAQLGAASVLTVLPYGRFAAIDLHTLPWRGRPLIEQVPVRYGLDVRRNDVVAAADGPPVAVIDPRADLAAARAEGSTVGGALAALDPRLVSLAGAGAHRGAVVDAISGASLFHFAGHGAFSSSAFDSALLLADGGQLTVSDVLVMERAPGIVVLSACESARSDGGPLVGLGIAQAFVTAGSAAAIAAVRPVDDTLAAAFSAAVYGHPKVLSEPGSAYVAAMRAVAVASPASDWSSFRLLVP
jgi:CHAT domain